MESDRDSESSDESDASVGNGGISMNTTKGESDQHQTDQSNKFKSRIQ